MPILNRVKRGPETQNVPISSYRNLISPKYILFATEAQNQILVLALNNLVTALKPGCLQWSVFSFQRTKFVSGSCTSHNSITKYPNTTEASSDLQSVTNNSLYHFQTQESKKCVCSAPSFLLQYRADVCSQVPRVKYDVSSSWVLEWQCVREWYLLAIFPSQTSVSTTSWTLWEPFIVLSHSNFKCYLG